MAKKSGVAVKNDNRNAVSITAIPAFKGHSPQFGSRFQKVKYDTDMPNNWGLPTDYKISLGLENQKIKLINRCKFMIFVHGIRDIPKHFLNTNKNYSLKYSFLDQSIKYSLNLKNAEDFE